MQITVATMNWRRPGNVVKIAAALVAQDHPCRKLVVTQPEASALPALPCEVVSVPSLGPYSRYLAEYGGDYALLIDDDLLPPAGLVGAFAAAAEKYPEAVLSLYGRRIKHGRYNFRGIGRTEKFEPVSMPVRMYWIPTGIIPAVREGYARWLAKGHAPEVLDDDILLAWVARKQGCYLLPKGIDCIGLPEPHSAASRTPNRIRHRSRAWEECRKMFS